MVGKPTIRLNAHERLVTRSRLVTANPVAPTGSRATRTQAPLKPTGRRWSEKCKGSAMTVFAAASQFSPDRVTYALRAVGDPLRYVRRVHDVVPAADSH